METSNQTPWRDFLHTQALGGAQRWLHALDLRHSSLSEGVADREYWAWKIKDFANGTWQGGLAGFLDVSKDLPLSEENIRRVVSATIRGSRWLQRSNGSFEEAYPLESSVAVTSLVVFDLLYARLCHGQFFSPAADQLLKEIVQKGCLFLSRTDETHGVISNHLATVLGALALGELYLHGMSRPEIWNPLLSLQDRDEHWFPEYGGADPGYQTLLNHYLLAFSQCCELPPPLKVALSRSLEFCALFCFPDGSYGGETGSRGTSVFYPSGLFSEHTAQWFGLSLTKLSTVTPVSVDQGNFVPVFNAWALLEKTLKPKPLTEAKSHPERCHTKLARAGLSILRTPQAMVCLNHRSGSLRKVVRIETGWVDESIVGFTKPTEYTGSVSKLEVTQSSIIAHLQSLRIPTTLNSPWRLVVLRLVGISLYPFPPLQRAFKKLLAKLVMNSRSTAGDKVILTIDITDDRLPVKIEHKEIGWSPQRYGFWKHMASANSFEMRGL